MIEVNSHQLAIGKAEYISWDPAHEMNWHAIGGYSTGHTEALRIVSGSETCIHPMGWPTCRGAEGVLFSFEQCPGDGSLGTGF